LAVTNRRHVRDTRVRHGNGTDDVGTGVSDVQGTGGDRDGRRGTRPGRVAAAARPLDRVRCVPGGGEPGPAVGAVLQRGQNRGHRVDARRRLGDGVPDDHPAVPGRKRTGHRRVDRPDKPHSRHGDGRHIGAQRRCHRRSGRGRRWRAGGHGAA